MPLCPPGLSILLCEAWRGLVAEIRDWLGSQRETMPWPLLTDQQCFQFFITIETSTDCQLESTELGFC